MLAMKMRRKSVADDDDEEDSVGDEYQILKSQ